MKTLFGEGSLRRSLARAFAAPWLWGMVTMFLGTVNVLFVLVTLSSARGAAETAARRAGEALLDQLGPSLIGNTQGVLLNGQRLFIAARSTKLPVVDVLDAFEKNCRDGASEWKEEMKSLPPATRALPAKYRDLSRALTLRMDPDGKSPGQVACIVPAGDMKGLSGLAQRFSDFAVSGDLSKLGDGRYAVVRRNEKTGTTLTVVVWTEGPFSMASMFPDHGDAPGKDSLYAPRPRDAVRLVSAEMEGRPYAMRTYETAHPRVEVLDGYTTDMTARGWDSQLMPKAPGFDLNGNARVFEKDGTAVIVTARDGAGGKTDVSLLEMASTGFVNTVDPVQ